MKNPDTSIVKVPYLTGGIQTRKKLFFRYGKVEVRAKFSNGQGLWPAIWMMPEDGSAGWPAWGEPEIYRVGEYIRSGIIDGHYKVELFNVSGQRLLTSHFSSTDITIHAPKGFVIVRITKSSGYSFSYKL